MDNLKSILLLTILAVSAFVFSGCSNCDSEDTLCFANSSIQNKSNNTNSGGAVGGGLKEVSISICQPIFTGPFIATASGERLNINGTNSSSSFIGGYPDMQLVTKEGVIQVFEGVATFVLKAKFFETFSNTTKPFCLMGDVTAQRPPLTQIDKFHIGVNSFASEINSSKALAHVYWDGMKFHFSIDDSFISDGPDRDLVKVLISVNLN